MSKASRDPKTGRFIGVSHKVSKPQHVLSAGKSGWVVKKEGAQKASRHFDTKEEAISWGVKLAKKNEVEIYIHDKNGRVLNKKTFKEKVKS